MQRLNSDLAVFGYGQITSQLISDFARDGKSIICVSNHRDFYLTEKLKKQVQFYGRSEIANYKLNCDSTLFVWKDSNALLENNGNLNKWLLSDNYNCNQSLYLSSASVYGDISGLISESKNNLESNVHANPKYVLEELLSVVMNSKSGRNLNLRVSNVYGLGLTYGFIAALLNSIKTGSSVKIFNGKKILRDYISVDDVSFAIRRLFNYPSKHEVINISTGIATSVSDVIGIFTKLGLVFDKAIEETVGDNVKSSLVLDCSLLSQLINWHPKLLSVEITSFLEDI